MPSTRRSGTVWAWDCQYPGQLSKVRAAASGRPTTMGLEQPFSSPCHAIGRPNIPTEMPLAFDGETPLRRRCSNHASPLNAMELTGGSYDAVFDDASCRSSRLKIIASDGTSSEFVLRGMCSSTVQ